MNEILLSQMKEVRNHADTRLRSESGFDELGIDADLFADGEADQLQSVLDGALDQPADGHILDIAGIEPVTLV